MTTTGDEAPRVAVCLSSGFFGFYCHAGFMAGLEAGGVRPAGIGGSSAGALTGAFIASGLSHETIRHRLFTLTTAEFFDPAGPLTWWRRGPALIKGRRFERLLESVLGDVKTFGQCKTPLAVTVFDIDGGIRRVLRSGPLIPAVVASCAMPFFFPPIDVGDGHRLWDGGFVDKTPVDAVADLMPGLPVVVHFLPSRRPAPNPWLLGGALSSLRKEVDRLRCEQTQNRQPVAWYETEAPPLGPWRLGRGPEAYRRGFDTGRHAATEILENFPTQRNIGPKA